MKKITNVVVAAAAMLALASCAVNHPEPPAQPPVAPVVSGTIGERMQTVTATVEKIDLKKRLVTLKGPDGKSVTVEVDERVKNLPQVKKGDQVTASYYESAAYEVKKPGQAEPGVTVAGAVGAAQPGQLPAAAGAHAITVTSTIEAIDKKAPSVTLKGPDGDLVTIKVRYPEKLEKVKVGDLVEITYTQALAIAVEAANK